MSVEHTDAVDFVSIDEKSGDVWLTISDHLAWDQDELRHLELLQDKLNAYIRFVESGEIFTKFPQVQGRKVVINLVCQFPLSDTARSFVAEAKSVVREAGIKLRLELLRPN